MSEELRQFQQMTTSQLQQRRASGSTTRRARGGSAASIHGLLQDAVQGTDKLIEEQNKKHQEVMEQSKALLEAQKAAAAAAAAAIQIGQEQTAALTSMSQGIVGLHKEMRKNSQCFLKIVDHVIARPSRTEETSSMSTLL